MKLHGQAVRATTLFISLFSASAFAGGTIKLSDEASISIGAGFRTALVAQDKGAPNGKDASKDFQLQSMRLYTSGQLKKNWKFTFNTEKAAENKMLVLDAVVQYEPSEQFNVWAGHLLTPADRIEMNGPYYALSWNQYTVPLYASDQDGQAGSFGRDDGVVVWGSADKFQYALGAFNGLQSDVNTSDSLLYAARFAYNFLNKEQNPGYYTSSTYYGKAGKIFTLGVSAQSQQDGVGVLENGGTVPKTISKDFSGYAADFLLELPTENGAFNLEGEYKSFENDYSALGEDNEFSLFNGDAYFVTAAYFFAGETGTSGWQPYIRRSEQSPKGGDKGDMNELGFNYIVNGHNLRLNLNATDAGSTNQSSERIKAVSFGIQVQI